MLRDVLRFNPNVAFSILYKDKKIRIFIGGREETRSLNP